MADRTLHVDLHALVDGMVLQGANHLQAGTVANVRQAWIAMPTKVALQDAPVFRAVEQRTPFLQQIDFRWRLLGMQLGHAPVIEHLAATHGIAEMRLPVIAGVDIGQGRRDAPFCHDSMGLAQQGLTDQSNRDTLG